MVVHDHLQDQRGGEVLGGPAVGQHGGGELVGADVGLGHAKHDGVHGRGVLGVAEEGLGLG